MFRRPADACEFACASAFASPVEADAFVSLCEFVFVQPSVGFHPSPLLSDAVLAFAETH